MTAPRRLMSLGLMLGEPSGMTFKMISPIHATHAWEMGLGWSMAGEDGIDYHAQHQWHLVEMTRSSRGSSTFYLGAGGRVKNVEGTRFGLRGAAGVSYVAGSRPRSWESFLEVAPILDLTPDTDAFLNAEIGVRWFLPAAARP